MEVIICRISLKTVSYTHLILEKNGLINRFLANFGIGPLEMINTQGAVVLGMVYNYLPFMILPLYSIMTKIPQNVIEAAQDLGCSSFQVLGKVLLPLTVPGISTGVIMVFVPSVSTFITVSYTHLPRMSFISASVETKCSAPLLPPIGLISAAGIPAALHTCVQSAPSAGATYPQFSS